MKNQWLKASAMMVIGIFSCSFVITLLNNLRIGNQPSLFYHFIDYLFFVSFIVFILGSMMLIGERGLFDVFIYSTHKVRSIISSKYVYTLKESESLEDHEIDHFLRNKYLYTKKKYQWTWPTFISSSLVLIGLLLYIFVFYGL